MFEAAHGLDAHLRIIRTGNTTDDALVIVLIMALMVVVEWVCCIWMGDIGGDG